MSFSPCPSLCVVWLLVVTDLGYRSENFLRTARKTFNYAEWKMGRATPAFFNVCEGIE